MNYRINANSKSNDDATIHIKKSSIDFVTTNSTSKSLPNPAELFLGSFAACMLKNVERFSKMMKFEYQKTDLEINADRLENPPRMDNIVYNLIIYSNDEKLNTGLLKKNIEKHGTIYNTVKRSCQITGMIKVENLQ
ncbi:OsmC family protein [Maribacter sp. M208]|uniref:OsmC family protein n=1 Tax=Maribacter huludaoensis TaxID=3030010 RepID=UPI0023EAB29D|nr:OsmC family protein [Maribacter huludaoensis]MDF4222131.1 OsmC family protein [Maribacter huludaoensis]